MNTAESERLVTIPLGQRSYPVVLSHDLSTGQASDILAAQLAGRPVALISNETVWPLHGETLLNAVRQAGPAQSTAFILPDGEENKTPQQWLRILDHLAENGVTRDGVLVALGGGVVCDMTGFAAACWMRGIEFIQVPTTLLAQVDASVGGKTGINHPAGKNLIGAFHQPSAVLANTEFLATLPEREYLSGLAEAIKYGFIQSAEFVHWLRQHRQALLRRDPEILDQLVEQCCRFKADVVQQDETEKGRRALLNLGHTFGHAIENLGQYRDLLHGEAVAIGTVMAARLSERLGLAPAGLSQEVTAALKDLNLPTGLPQPAAEAETRRYSPQALLQRMRLDKKVSQGKHRLVLMRGLGQATLAEGIAEADILPVLESFCQAV